MTKTDAKWLERVGQWKESGQTAEEFAVGQPFKASTLKWRAAELLLPLDRCHNHRHGHDRRHGHGHDHPPAQPAITTTITTT